MVRTLVFHAPPHRGSPPARGDGPNPCAMQKCTQPFSPRTGGWSGDGVATAQECGVLPPHGGMVRSSRLSCFKKHGSPPARGDGPIQQEIAGDINLFSPRTGGWSAKTLPILPGLSVLPPHGGMVRAPPVHPAQWSRSPPARGDGPTPGSKRNRDWQFSPRTGGWSGVTAVGCPAHAVLPPHGGMVRRAVAFSGQLSRSPPARGDGPPFSPNPLCPTQFSPRTGGWSVASNASRVLPYVLPPHGGMVRLEVYAASLVCCSPPARGDGPRIAPLH